MNNFLFKKSTVFFTYLLSLISLAQAVDRPIDELDKICADHMLMVFHAYEQAKSEDIQEINFQTSISYGGSFLGYRAYDLHMGPVPASMCDGWRFQPIYGETGVQFSFLDHRYKSLVGMVAFNNEKKILSISFRSTRQLSDWWHNLNYMSRECPYIAPDQMVLFHSGYLDICENALPSLIEAVSQIGGDTNVQTMEDVQVLVTGHSLGGSTAAVSIPYIKQLFPKNAIRLTTFGAPLVSDDGYNEWLKSQDVVSKSFVRATDVTPSLKLDLHRQYLGQYIELPHYDDWSILWVPAHDDRKYHRAIYEALGLEPSNNLYSLYVGGFAI